MIAIYADFNCMDEQGRVWLDTPGSLADIEPQRGALREGLRVLLYVPGDFTVEAVLSFDRAWRATPDLATLRHVEASPP